MVGANTAPGAGHAEPQDQLSSEERRLRLWAYASSPYGLGLPFGAIWKLSPREFLALRNIHDQQLRRWALERAMFANAHFRGKDTAAFIPEDFLGTSNYDERQRDQQREQLQVMQANASLAKIKRGAPPTEDVPAWARG